MSAPKGVNGKEQRHTLIKKYLGWEPSTPLRVGMEKRIAGSTTSTWRASGAKRAWSGALTLGVEYQTRFRSARGRFQSFLVV